MSKRFPQFDGMRQDGMTADEWLAAQFHHTYCADCGRDADDHKVIIGQHGLFFALCLKDPLTEDERVAR